MADDIQSNIRINIDTASAMDSIRLLQNQISAFHTQMAKMGAASAADSRNLQQNLINSINSTGAFSANMVRVRTTAEQFTHSLEKNKLTMGEYFRYAGGASKTFGKLFTSEFQTINKVARERVKDLQSQYIKMGRDANGAMQAIKVRPLALDMQNLATKTQIMAQRQQLLNQLLKQGSTNLLNFGKNTQWAGRQLMVGFTIPLAIMGSAAMKAYQQIEEASIRLKRVYGDLSTSNAETNKMVDQVKQLALEYTKYGVAVKDSMDMAASAAATGKKGADLIAQVASANKLSVLGGVDQQKALQTTISLTNAFNISSKDLAKNINFLNAVENQTVLNIDDMTTAIPKAAPVIQQLGGDVKDLAFFLTAMKEGGVNASEGANALKSGLASLINPTNSASKMLSGFGINIKGIVEKDKGDLKKTVVDFAQALDTLDPLNRARAIEQLFGKFQFARMSTLFKNVIAQGSQASEVLKLAGTSSLELAMLSQKELNKISESPLYKFQKAIADFQAQLAPVGEQFMKAITPLINFGADVLKNFNGLGEGVKGFIVKFVAVAGIVGPVLLMSFGLIANAVANVVKGFALMKDVFNRTGKSSLSLGEQINYMTQEQIQASAIASSLDQVHSKLKQTFTSEAAAVDVLTSAYERSVAAQRAFSVPIMPRGPIRKYASGGMISGPGTGTSDSILAMVSNGEAIIPASSVARNPGMVRQLVSGNIPGFADGLVPAYTNAVALLKDTTNQALKTGVSGTSLASEIRGIGPGMNAPIVEAIAKSLGAKNNSQVIGMLRNNPDLRSFAQSIQVGVAQEMDAIGNRKIQDPELSKIYQTVARKEAAARGQVFAEQTEKFLTTPTTFEDTTTTRQRSSGRVMSIGRATLFSGLASYRNKNYKPIAQELGTDPTGLVKAHMSDRTFISLKEATTKFGIELSNQAKAAADRMANGIIKVSQSIKPRMQQAEAAVAQGMAEAGKMQSPSRVTKQKGAQLVQGAVQGIQEGVDDVRRAGTQLGLAAAQGVSQSGRTGRRASSEGNLVFIPGQGYVSEGQLARDTALANAPMIGPREGTRLEKFKAGFNANSVYRRIQSTDQGKLASGIRNKSFGASGALAIGSMVVPGEAGQMMGMASMLTSFGGMGAGTIAKGLKSLSPSIVNLGFKFLKFVPYVGAAITAFEIFDKAIVPLIRKNADAFNAISDTLNITKEKIQGINDFFGTDIKATGIRDTTIVSGGQSVKQATVAQQFQQSEQFKNTYQESAQKLKDLTDVEFKRAMQFMATDLFGQGMDKDLVKAIIDAIAIEAKKSSVSIAPELFSLDNPETKTLMSKNLNNVLTSAAKTAKELQGQFNQSGEGTLLQAGSGQLDGFWSAPWASNPEDIAKFKASMSEIGSYMSSLSGQFTNGTISGKEFELQYQKLINMTNSKMGTSGVEALKAAFISLNAEIGNALALLSASQFKTVSRAILAGVAPTEESISVFNFGTEEQKAKQTRLYNEAYKQQLILNAQKTEQEKKIKSIQNKSQDIVNTEEKINEKYDKRIAQIEKIKRLNEQIAKSQQGQLTLAEALNSGDIAAAAKAAIDVQNNDIQTSLDNQQTGLQDARKAELAPLSDAQNANTKAIQDLTSKLDNLNSIEITVKNATNKVLTDPNILGTNIFGQEVRKSGLSDITNWLSDNLLSWLGVTSATGGHITGPGTGTSDSIPARLSNGEYVIRANAVKTIGVDTLNKLNQADRLGFASGGMVRHFKGGGYNGYADGGYIPREGGLPSNEKLPADTANFQDMHGWMVARPGAGLNERGDEIYGYSRNEKTGKYTFDSAMDAYTYYRILLKNRRALVPHIEQKYQEHLNGGWMYPDDSKNYRISNLVSNKTYGPFNGLTQVEARTFAKSISAVYGKKSLPKMWKQFGLDPKLLGKPIKLTAEQKRLYNAFAGEITPSLSDNAPRFSYYADGGYVGPRPAPQWDAKGRWVVSHGESYWSTAGNTLPGGMEIGPWWSRILKSNIDPTTGKERRLYRNSRIWIPGSQEPFPPKSGIPRIFPKKKKPLYTGSGEISLHENHLYGGNVGGGLLGNMTKLFADGGMVGYKDGGKPKPPHSAWSMTQKKVPYWDAQGKIFYDTVPPSPWNTGDYLKISDPTIRRQRWALSNDDSGLMEFGRTAAYFTPGIGAGMLAGDSATAFGKGDIGGGFLNALLAPLGAYGGALAKFAGKGLGTIGNFVKTGLGIRGGKNALKALATSTGANVSKVGKLSPRLGFNLSDEALQNMIKDNFYGNMRTGIRSSTSDTLMNRIAVEKNMMGIPANAPGSKTPAYGFLTSKEDVPSYWNSIWGGMGPRSNEQASIDNFNLLINSQSRYLERYGSNTIKLKPGALGRATISPGDSLSIWDQAIRLGQKIPRVDKLSSLFSTFPELYGKLKSTQNMMNKDIPGIKGPTSFPYIEAHLPGGFTVKDIESILLHPTTKFGPHDKEKIAADLLERQTALQALLKSLGFDIKIGTNPGIGMLPELPKKRYAAGGMVLNGKFLNGFSHGGMVPSYLAQGGYAMGTDTVPAMLTPGEFVIKKSAVDRIGPSTLNKINGYANGGLVGGMATTSSDSVYNNNTYEINVNVSSMSNPNDIAHAVMRQIKQIDNGRIRGLNG